MKEGSAGPESILSVAVPQEAGAGVEWHHTGCGVCSRDGVAALSYSKELRQVLPVLRGVAALIWVVAPEA